jgi:hypothetical protein
MALKIYDIYSAVGPIFRRRRQQQFLERFRPTNTTTILDVGGYHHFWRELPVTPSITLLNVYHPPELPEMPPNFTFVRGDGRRLPFADQSFDLVFSNSVIEHVGTFDDQKLFAAEARRVGRNLSVQTPNRSFPIEPHFIGPRIPGLPRERQRFVYRWLSVRGWLRRRDHADFNALFEEVRLLTFAEVQSLFPDCAIVREKLFGLTKSFTAVRQVARPID